MNPIFEPITTHELRTRTGDNRDMLIISGYAHVNLKGNEDGSWNRKELKFYVGSKWSQLRERDVVPVVSLTSIMNVNVANNAGWAVDDCNVELESSPGQKQVVLRTLLATRDRDGILYRLNYYVTMVGQLL
jgi:hypothetical protein